MAEVQLQKIRALYGEFKGLLLALPTSGATAVAASTGIQYNSSIDELSFVSQTDYSRYKLTASDNFGGMRDLFNPIATRAKISSIVHRLEEEYSFGQSSVSSQPSPVVVTVNQNQQVTVSVTPISDIINSVESADLREDLNELKNALETSKDQKSASSILNSIQQKSWEIFIRVLPYVLEHLGQHPK